MIICKHHVTPVSNHPLGSTAPVEIEADVEACCKTTNRTEKPMAPMETPSYTTLPEAIQQIVDRY